MNDMAKGDWWIKFDIHAWLNDPRRRMLSRENSDSWLTAFLLMELEGTYKIEGSPKDLANMLHLTAAEFRNFIADMKRTKTAEIQNVPKCPRNVLIMSRRLKRDWDAREYERLKKKRQRVPELSPKCPDTIVISKKKEVRKEEEKNGTEAVPKTPPRKANPVSMPTRIPAPFPITPEMWAWLTENVPDLDDVNGAHANFIEYWTNAPPSKAEKVNWNLTWQKGMRLAKKWQDEEKQNGSNSKRTGPDRRTDTEILRDSAQQIASKYSN